MSDDTDWIEAPEAAKIMGVSVRQLHRYREAGKLITRPAGRRSVFSRASVEALANEHAVKARPVPAAPVEVMPQSALLDYITEQARELKEAHLEIGRLQARLQIAESQVQQLTAAQPQQPAAPRSWLDRLLRRH